VVVVVVVTVPGDQVDALIASVGDALVGRVVIDATNALAPGVAGLDHVDALTTASGTPLKRARPRGQAVSDAPLLAVRGAGPKAIAVVASTPGQPAPCDDSRPIGEQRGPR
jgi:hypothetical protein